VINILAVCWIVIGALFVCFPQYVPVNLETMNWAPVVFGVVITISVVNWFVVRSSYEPPHGLRHGPSC
jgi:hypothetical protein